MYRCRRGHPWKRMWICAYTWAGIQVCISLPTEPRSKDSPVVTGTADTQTLVPDAIPQGQESGLWGASSVIGPGRELHKTDPGHPVSRSARKRGSPRSKKGGTVTEGCQGDSANEGTDHQRVDNSSNKINTTVSDRNPGYKMYVGESTLPSMNG